MQEKEVSFQMTSPYSTLNTWGPATENVWVVFHGMGYLSRYFLRHFRSLRPESNYIIAPQALAKHYLGKDFRHVGACWLTRERTQPEMENILHYLDQIYQVEKLDQAPKLFLMGFSQGVSIVSRWIAKRKISFHKLILHSGKFPEELKADDFYFLDKAEVHGLYGLQDPYLDSTLLQKETERIDRVFGNLASIHTFSGGHHVQEELLKDLARNSKNPGQ